MAWLNAAVLFAVVIAAAYLLAPYLTKVFTGEPTLLSGPLRPLERGIYVPCHIDPAAEMGWEQYALAALCFTACGTALLYAILRTQQWLPLNPQHFPNLDPIVAWNTAVSFAPTTDWQVYSGENAMSYFSQMVGLAWQNFTAGAVGLAVSIAVIGGFARPSASCTCCCRSVRSSACFSLRKACRKTSIHTSPLPPVLGRMTGFRRAGTVLLGTIVLLAAAALIPAQFAEQHAACSLRL